MSLENVRLAESALRASPYTKIFYPVAKSPVRQKINASQELFASNIS